MQIKGTWWGTIVLASSLVLFAGCGTESGGKASDGGTSDGGASSGETHAGDTSGADASGGEAAEDEIPMPPAKIDIEAARSRGKTAMFVPAPSEFEAALKAANIDADLPSLVGGEDRPLDGRSKPLVALETGRRLANLLMSAGSGEKSALLARMDSARAGLEALGAPPELMAKADKLKEDFQGDVIAGDGLVPALDHLSGELQRELKTGAGDEVATLVQAGGWVQGVNLLTKALEGKDAGPDARALLHQPTVLAHFMGFIKDSAPAKADDPDVAAVIAEMEKMAAIEAKPELTNEDIAALRIHTAAVLARF